jgi:hypothetical protein
MQDCLAAGRLTAAHYAVACAAYRPLAFIFREAENEWSEWRDFERFAAGERNDPADHCERETRGARATRRESRGLR